MTIDTNKTLDRATLSVKELAGLLGISENLAYCWLYQKKIPARQIGRKWVISHEAVISWLNESKEG